MGPSFARACVVVAAAVTAVVGCSKKEAPSGTGAPAPSASAARAGLPTGSSLAFLEGFEGEIGLVFQDASRGAKPPTALSLLVKDVKVRVEIPADVAASSGMGNKGYAVLDTPEKKLYAVIEDKKQVVLVDLDKAGDSLKMLGSGGAPRAREAAKGRPSEPPPKVTKTGLKDTVAGYGCDLWDIVANDGDKVRACVANEGGSWFRLPLANLPSEHAWALELLDGQHFPLSGIAYDKAGAEKGRVEVTKIDKKALAANLFEIPAGYQVVDLRQMFTAFGAMAGSPMGAAMMGKMPPGFPPGMTPPGMTAPKSPAPRGSAPAPKRP
jgi:hypothetical protein